MRAVIDLPFQFQPVVATDAVFSVNAIWHIVSVYVKHANQFILKKSIKLKTCQIAAMRFPQG
jgi:hypothetical protein